MHIFFEIPKETASSFPIRIFFYLILQLHNPKSLSLIAELVILFVQLKKGKKLQ